MKIEDIKVGMVLKTNNKRANGNGKVIAILDYNCALLEMSVSSFYTFDIQYIQDHENYENWVKKVSKIIKSGSLNLQKDKEYCWFTAEQLINAKVCGSVMLTE